MFKKLKFLKPKKSKRAQAVMEFLSYKTESFMPRKSKSQAAMEFLMTYGWALLVVLIAIAALAYFGLLNPSRFLPDKTDLGPGLTVAGIEADPYKVTLYVQNGLGKKLNDFQINITECNDNSGALSTAVNIIEGKTQKIIVNCDTGVEKGKKFNSDIVVNYSTKMLQNILDHEKKGETVITLGEIQVQSYEEAILAGEPAPSCVNGAQCDSGYCARGSCTNASGIDLGGSCSDDQNHFECKTGICNTILQCSIGNVGDWCNRDEHCNTGNICNSSSMQCIVQAGTGIDGELGSLCYTTTQCDSGYCVSNVCTSGEIGASCFGAPDCQSNLCMDCGSGNQCTGDTGSACSIDADCMCGMLVCVAGACEWP